MSRMNVYDSSSSNSDTENPDDEIKQPRRSKRLRSQNTRKERPDDNDEEPKQLDEIGDSEEIADHRSRRKVTRKRKLSTKKAVPITTKHAGKKITLTKEERSKIAQFVKDMTLNDSLRQVKACFTEEMKCRDLGLSEIINNFFTKVALLNSLIEYHRNVFLDLYNKCSTGKEKYLRLQLEWHAQCSVFLLPKDLPAQCVLPDLKDDEAICAIRTLWQEFCDSYPFDMCNKLMILFSSIMYKILLDRVHSFSTSTCSSQETDPSPCVNEDDIYYRFGGATISAMLKVRYKKHKKTASTSATCSSLSDEIAILHAINTKDKKSMPEYLKYRDRGFMYSPHATFIPFFRDVDHCVQEVVNPNGFQHHTHELVKVKIIFCIVI